MKNIFIKSILLVTVVSTLLVGCGNSANTESTDAVKDTADTNTEAISEDDIAKSDDIVDDTNADGEVADATEDNIFVGQWLSVDCFMDDVPVTIWDLEATTPDDVENEIVNPEYDFGTVLTINNDGTFSLSNALADITRNYSVDGYHFYEDGNGNTVTMQAVYSDENNVIYAMTQYGEDHLITYTFIPMPENGKKESIIGEWGISIFSKDQNVNPEKIDNKFNNHEMGNPYDMIYNFKEDNTVDITLANGDAITCTYKIDGYILWIVWPEEYNQPDRGFIMIADENDSSVISLESIPSKIEDTILITALDRISDRYDENNTDVDTMIIGQWDQKYIYNGSTLILADISREATEYFRENSSELVMIDGMIFEGNGEGYYSFHGMDNLEHFTYTIDGNYISVNSGYIEFKDKFYYNPKTDMIYYYSDEGAYPYILTMDRN